MRLPLLIILAFCLAGCEAMPSRLTERFARVEPQIRLAETVRGNVYPAVQEALERIRFTVTRARQAEGVVEGRSRILTDDTFRGANQYELEVRISQFDTNLTKLAVILRELSEDSSTARASYQDLGTHGIYDSFFNALEQVLVEQGHLAGPGALRAP